MADRRATVWAGTSRVGTLRIDAHGLIHLRYEPAWLDCGFPLSISLPFSHGDSEVVAHGFFEGLLPEGAHRQRLARKLGIDPQDDASLLLALGDDVAGAISITADDAPPEHSPAPMPLTDDAFSDLVRSRGQARATDPDRPWRFSLAGAQDKLPIRIHTDGTFHLPNRSYPSTHILKFETISHVCFAEHITLRIAARIGLPVVDSTFHRMEQDPASPWLLIPRYDRDADTARLHQEDMIQALGLESVVKYEADGGPRLRDIVTLVRDHCAEPLPAVRHLIDWQIFNILVGNFDGHGKNLAFLYRPGHAVPDLAPFYDLIAIAWLNQVHQHAPYSQSLAFRVGQASRTEKIGLDDWRTWADDIGVRPRLVLERVRTMAEQLPRAADEEITEFARIHGPRPIHQTFVQTIERRCEWFRRQQAAPDSRA